MRELLLALLLVVASSAVHGHDVLLAVWPAGDVVEGEVAFSSGALAAPGTVVRVLGPDGGELGKTKVDDDGLFRFAPTAAVPHRFVADLGQGHVAAATLAVDELPATVAAPAEAAAGTAQAATAATTAASGAAADALGRIDAGDLETIVAAAVQRELAPLKRQLAAREQAADLQSVIGGIGYICGIFGLLFFLHARRRRA